MKTKEEERQRDREERKRQREEKERQNRQKEIACCVSRKVNKENFIRFGVAVMRAAYYQLPMEESNSREHLCKNDVLPGIDAAVTIEGLCRFAYEVEEPSFEQMNAIRTTMEELRGAHMVINEKTETHIYYNFVLYIAYIREKDGIKFYPLYLHDFFYDMLSYLIDKREGNVVEQEIPFHPLFVPRNKERIANAFNKKTREVKEEIMGAVYDYLSEQVTWYEQKYQ